MELFKKYKYKASVGVGLYYDDPKNTEKNRTRAVVGYIIDSTLFNKVGDDYNKVVFPKSNAITTTFELRTKISMLFGVIKVYPKLSKAIEKENLHKKSFAIMEIYNRPKKIIEYIAPIEVADSVFLNIIN